MRTIDAALLHELAQGGTLSLMASLAPILARALAPSGIDTLPRQAHFLAQGVFETAYLTTLEENLNYSASRIPEVWDRLADRAAALAGNPEALANAAYAGVNGNGDEASGDGWRYRGRGFFQLTGRENYRIYAADMDPDAVGVPDGAVASAITFWTIRKCNEAADVDSTIGVTRLVNGGLNGLPERKVLKQRAQRLLAT